MIQSKNPVSERERGRMKKNKKNPACSSETETVPIEYLASL